MTNEQIHKRIRELELTVQSLQRTAAEVDAALDRALEAKVRLIADHMGERTRRQAADAELKEVESVVVDLKKALALAPANADGDAALGRANDWVLRRRARVAVDSG